MRRLPRLAPVLLVGAIAASGCAELSADDEAAIERMLGRELPSADGAVEAFALPDTVVEPDSSVGVIDRDMQSADRPDVKPVPCPFDELAVTDVDCGEIEMPGRGADDDYEITITFARFNATGDADAYRPDPVVYLHGGPGGSIVADAEFWYDSIVAPHIDVRDVILYDQRGGGESTTLPVCDGATEAAERFHTTVLRHEDLAADYIAGLAACAETVAAAGHDLTAYNSRINAQDLIDLLWAIGVEQYNLHGSSYGSRLAQTVMRDEPSGARSLVLSGVYPIDANLMGSVPTSIESALEVVFDGCAADDRCAEALPDPWTALEALVAELDRSPLSLDVPLTSEESYRTRFDGTDLLNGIHNVLYVGTDAAEIPDLLIDWADGDRRRVERMGRESLFDYTDTATFLLVQCADENRFTQPADLDRPLDHEFLRAVDLAPAINGVDSRTICGSWDTGATPPIANEPVGWDVPTLLFAGASDPITPPQWARQLAERLPRARLIERADMSHDADDGWCATTMIASFVARPEVLPDVDCVATPTILPMPNLAERLREPWEMVDATLDLDDDGEFVDVRLPNWWSNWEGDAHIRWRDLDVYDPTAVIVRAAGSEYDLVAHLPFEFFRPPPWTNEPSTITPPGWSRHVLDTTGGTLYRWTNERSEADITIVVEPGEPDDLETRVLLPLAESMGTES
ncbi:MAG: alpha/beta fold hydrolase [Actinomycetota bacterium]